MKTTWQKVKLGQIIEINPEAIDKNYDHSEIEYVDISSVGSGVLEETTKLLLDEAPGRARRIVRDGDTILSTVRPNRRSFLFIKNPLPNLVVSTGFAVLRSKKDIDPRYLYYHVTNQPFTNYLVNHAKGAAYPAVDTESIARAAIDLPDLSTQRRIAEILSAYDDLIENNNHRIKILEQMAQSIYREWFVDFRFPGHEKVKMVNSKLGRIPEEWEERKLGEIASVIGGYAFKSSDFNKHGIPVIKIKNICSNNTVDCTNTDYVSSDMLTDRIKKYVLKSGDIIVAMTGATAGKIGRVSTDKKMLLNQRVAKVEPKKDLYYSLIWGRCVMAESKREIYNLAGGAAQPNMSSDQIGGIDIMVPTLFMLKMFNELLMPMLDEILYLQKNINILSQTRDLLLPKLVGGEVEV